MDKVFELYVMDKDQYIRSASLTLPASMHELTDALDQTGAESVREMYFEVEESCRGEYLADVLENSITLPELNILAWRIAEMDEGQEAVLEGLVKMEAKKQDSGRLPYLKLLQLTENTDCCHWVPQARNDSQLGRFYAENGFVEGVDDLPDMYGLSPVSEGPPWGRDAGKDPGRGLGGHQSSAGAFGAIQAYCTEGHPPAAQRCREKDRGK